MMNSNCHGDIRDPSPLVLSPPWRVAEQHSHYLRNLLAARPEVAAWLGEHAAQPPTV
ncbi:MAG: hypothetical protein JNK99_17525, partial [Candidatus Accumulibacter sp.]|nr:hypothetical protein [Accumulibacter sp.]